MVSRNLTIPEIAAELHVSNVIDGTINVVGDNIRVSVQLIDAESGDLLDSGNFTAPLSEMSGLYAAVASQITNMVVSRLPLPVPPPAPYLAVNLGAGQDAYLDGRASLALRTPEGIRVAIESLSESVRLQPRFAPAHLNLGTVRRHMRNCRLRTLWRCSTALMSVWMGTSWPRGRSQQRKRRCGWTRTLHRATRRADIWAP